MPRYLRHPDGRVETLEEPTASHAAGDAPRTADGTPIGTDGLPVPAAPGPAAPEPAVPAAPEPTPPAAPEPTPPAAPATTPPAAMED